MLDLKGVKLYTTHCPKCNVLEKKLKLSGISFEIVEDFDVDKMVEKGFSSAPILEVDGILKNYTDAVKWINSL